MRQISSDLKRLVPRRVRRELKIRSAAFLEGVGVHALSHPALMDLDRRMATYLGPTPGVFLEIGANDGFSQSNTYYLERVRGWSGILVEPLPSLHARCRRLRRASETVNAACVGPEGPLVVEVVDLDLMSVTLGEQDTDEEQARLRDWSVTAVQVRATTLSAVIDASSFDSVDFMSIDVEGAEASVLAGLDLKRHAPTWLLIETAHPDSIAEMLAGRMELEARMTQHDYLFRRVEPEV